MFTEFESNECTAAVGIGGQTACHLYPLCGCGDSTDSGDSSTDMDIDTTLEYNRKVKRLVNSLTDPTVVLSMEERLLLADFIDSHLPFYWGL